MKKFLILLLCTLVLFGCQKKEEPKAEKKDDKFVLEKIDSTKDYVYLTKYTSLDVWGEPKDINILTINIKGETIDNINMELKNFVVNSVNKYYVEENYLVQGNVIDYDYYVSDKYIYVIQRYFMTSDDMVGDKKENVYVISLETGKKLSNEDILKIFELSEEQLYEKIEKKLRSTDLDYWMSIIRKNGYTLYITDNNKLAVLLDIETESELIKKELVFN